MDNTVKEKLKPVRERLKEADTNDAVNKIVNEVTGKTGKGIRGDKYDQLKRDISDILSQKKPRVNKETKPAYTAFALAVRSITSHNGTRNNELLKRVNKFIEIHRLEG